ncbi:MAG: hypothetical protein AAFQ02_03830 [Bacteroidota bacterium]
MRHLSSVLLFLFMFIIYACSSEEEEPIMPSTPDIIGTYTLDSGRDDNCTDPNDNVSFDNAGIGICVTIGDERTCSEFTIVFTPDEFTFEQVNTIDVNGTVVDTEVFTERGTYAFVGDQVRTTDTINGIVTDYDIINNGRFLDWLAARTDRGCDRIFRFSR